MIYKRKNEKLKDCLTSFALQWFDCVSSGAYEKASEMLDGQDSVCFYWNEEKIYRTVSSFTGTSNPKVSDPDKTIGTPYVEIYPTIEGLGHHLDHSLPIDGIWSELIVRFTFIRSQGGYIASIEDIEEAD